MKRSLTAVMLALVLFVGILASPALAHSKNYRSYSYHNIINPINTCGRYPIITIYRGDRAGMLLRLNNWYANMGIGVPKEATPESEDKAQESPKPEEKPVPEEQPKQDNTPSSEKKPTPEPKPEPKPVEKPAPIPTPQPEKEPTPTPEPKPAPEVKPAPKPAPEEKKQTDKKSQVPAAPQGIGNQQAQMLEKVNEERLNAGLSPLKWDGNLASVAQTKAKDMSDNNYFDHNSPTYGSPFEMMKKFGISYRAAGENLAGSSSVDRAHTGLMNSDGHRKNILNPNFTHIGIGVEKSSRYGYVYVQMFIGK